MHVATCYQILVKLKTSIPDIRIDEDELEVWVRPMIRSEVLNNFYVIRSLVKTDIAGQLDPQVMKTQRDEIETILRPMCNSVATVGAMAIMHGGGN